MAFRDVALDRYILYDTAVTVTVPQLYSDSHGLLFRSQKCTNSNSVRTEPEMFKIL